MGRPLKIAKAQAVLTITDTATAGSVVTVSQNLNTLGIIEGMSFTPASSISGLSANTTYYIAQILSSTTFSASTTQLSVQPRVMATLSDSTGGSVAASVNVVDAYFNNPVSGAGFPATNANTYGVVGGNTAIIGKQVLCNVAFGVQGTGTQVSSTSSNVVVGLGTDFANIANGTIIFAQYGTTGYGANTVIGTGAVTLIGTVANNIGNVTVAVANSTATGNVIRTSGNAQTLVLGGAVTFDTAFGGLTASTPYFVKTIANASAFTVSATPGGAPQAITSNASVTSNAIQQQLVLAAVAANNSTGVSGAGDTFVQALPESGYILRQKGKTKYLVQGTTTGLVGAVYTANVANTALTPNTMSVIATYDDNSTQYVSSVNDYQTRVFPTTVADGSLTPGSLYTIYYSGDTNWTAIGAASNITGVTFTATAAGGSGTGTAVLNTANPDVISTFNTAYAANTYGGQPNPIVIINNA
jgi:hypothetical protein